MLPDAGSDAGTPDAGRIDGGLDAGTPDAGTPDAGVPDAGADAGSLDAGSPDAGSPDAGPRDAGIAGTAQSTLAPTGAPGCDGIFPATLPEPRTVTWELNYDRGQGNWFVGATGVDGEGDIALAFDSDHSSYPYDENRIAVRTLDGADAGGVSGFVIAMRDRGFITFHPAVDYGQASLINAWTRDGDAGYLHTGTIYPSERYETHRCSYALGTTGSLKAECWQADAGSTLQAYDDSIHPVGTPSTVPDGGGLAALDDRWTLLERAPDLHWINPDGTRRSGAVLDGGFPSGARPLIGGGFDLPDGVLAADATQLSPRPAWLSANDKRPLVILRGRRAYAIPSYAGDPGGQCQRQIEVLLPDGTSCGKLQIREPQDCDGGVPLVNPSGTILEPVPLDLYDGGTRTVAYRVWVRLLQ